MLPINTSNIPVITIFQKNIRVVIAQFPRDPHIYQFLYRCFVLRLSYMCRTVALKGIYTAQDTTHVSQASPEAPSTASMVRCFPKKSYNVYEFILHIEK